MDYSKDVRINPDSLDVDWLAQADLTLQYGNVLSEAKRKVDICKEAVDVAYAKAILHCSELKGPDGKKMYTVDGAKAAAELIPDYRQAVSNYTQAQYARNLVQSAYDAIQAKKSALENLVRLNGQGYFASPQDPRTLGERASFGQQARENVRSAAAKTAYEAGQRRMRTQQPTNN